MSFPTQMRSIVTGAGSGLGRALAVELGRRGGRVLVTDLDPNAAAETARLVEEAGGKAWAAACDVRKLGQVEGLGDLAESYMGGVDAVVNNAGVAVAGAVGEVPIDDWQWVVDVNLWGVIYGCHVFAPRLAAQGRGWILNVASAAGLLAAPRMAPYNVTKAGVVSLSETLAAEVGDAGVHVTVLCPTFFRTRIMESSRGATEQMQKAVGKLMDRAPIQADGVAKKALEAMEKGRLYAVPMRDGRNYWRVKRLFPERFPKLLGAVNKRVNKKKKG